MADQITTSLAQAKVLVMQGMAGKAPRINPDNQHWEVWDNATQAWVDTGYSCNGAEGLDGHSPYINSSGYWVVFNDGTQQWVTTDVVAWGVDGVSPTVTVSDALNGKTITVTDAEHPQGQSVTIYNGTNGKSPYADATTGTWWVYDDASGLWVDSHVTAVGTNGKSPYINSTGYWVFWNDSTGAWVVTNYKAAGTNGADGHSPYIGANGHWFAWDENLDAFDDTGVAAQGPQGPTPPLATDVNMSDWTQGKTVDASVLKTDFEVALGQLATANQAILTLDRTKADASDLPVFIDIADDGSMEINGDAVTAAAVSAMILAGKSVIGLYDPLLNGDKIPLYPSFVSDLGTVEFSGFRQSVSGVITSVYGSAQGTDDVLVMQSRAVRELPAVSASDNGKSLVVENGVWSASSALQTKSITDTGGYYTTDTVEGALQEIGAELSGVNTLIGTGVIT